MVNRCVCLYDSHSITVCLQAIKKRACSVTHINKIIQRFLQFIKEYFMQPK